MAERIVNLDNSSRTVVTLQLAGKSFTVRRIVTGAHRLWLAFVQETVTNLERIDAYQKAVANMPNDLEEIQKQTEKITREIDAFAESKLERLLGIIELLLIKNGYAFDREWWIDNAGEEDYREFITQVMLKDQEPGTKKNEVAEET